MKQEFINSLINWQGKVGRFKMNDGSIRSVGIHEVYPSEKKVKVIPGSLLAEIKRIEQEKGNILEFYKNEKNFDVISMNEIEEFLPTGITEGIKNN